MPLGDHCHENHVPASKNQGENPACQVTFHRDLNRSGE
jgi:hypothetical protein